MTDTNITLPSSPADREKIRQQINEGVNCHIKIADQREALKDIVNVIHSDFGLPKKLITRLIKTHYKRDKDEQIAATEEFELVYETILERPLRKDEAGTTSNSSDSVRSEED